ncbi:MBL fold metallo-hydrolase [Sphingomonas sp.]|uniref:MBL fold metallo-hydrolase n=1 Tax=Sphingomonas sp. TaxID=28214 RepID=UPI0025E27C0D|nr:MBL fold metallo-hydrolase [Sphingomonas sp.]MBV9529066.1 MBL fold metallo-hydrolase [Sphingomonas sp.]
MPIHICKECGTSYADAPSPPARCPICEDERQYVPRTGQAWTTPEALAAAHVNAWRRLEPGLFEIHTWPDFAIGQRALLVRTPAGNYLWDCIALIDDATVELIMGLGGLKGIAISHPHYYTTCQDWAAAFDCPVHLHGADREWVMRPDAAIRFWEGDTLELCPQVTLMRLGGHYPGSTVMYWRSGDRGQAALLTGDTLQVVANPCRVSFMYSYPNLLPLSAATVRRIASKLQQWRVDRVYGFNVGRQILENGGAAIERSASRYIDLLSEER